eukprot:TRINITY_DN23033_c0_g4_i1.p1 TRINITY_DN23033_c0_g4~~TRINITY_DN23033_c0_g4_i1.p1  ORF type:complete len:154 (-),score=9.82 TRINITY_DN23033_c0_g4_i1:153-614(-)
MQPSDSLTFSMDSISQCLPTDRAGPTIRPVPYSSWANSAKQSMSSGCESSSGGRSLRVECDTLDQDHAVDSVLRRHDAPLKKDVSCIRRQAINGKALSDLDKRARAYRKKRASWPLSAKLQNMLAELRDQNRDPLGAEPQRTRSHELPVRISL